MGTYVTIASARRTSGINVGEINDTDVEAIITECEPEIERFYNTAFTPKTRIEVRDGNDTLRMVLRNNPVLSVRELKIDGNTEDPANLHIYRGSGKIELSTSATTSTFIAKSKAVIIKYVYGFLEESSTSTTTSAAEVAGTNVSIAVGSITGFANGDWVDIYGMDGHQESAQINAVPSAGAIQVDQLVYSHLLGSTVVKLSISENMKKLMNYAVAIAMVARLVGQSYKDKTGYGLGELNVQKGEPYTQWRETATQLIKERDLIMNSIKPRPCVM